MGGKEDKFDKFDEYGQLAGGYDAGIAREKALEHAQTVLVKQTDWLRGLRLAWEIETSKFDEDDDCYKVIINCYPMATEIEEKARFEYHVEATGKLYPGTPIRRAIGKWNAVQPEDKTKYCVHCGQIISYDAISCNFCGKSLAPKTGSFGQVILKRLFNKKNTQETTKPDLNEKIKVKKGTSIDECPGCGMASLYWNNKSNLFECLNANCRQRFTEKQYAISLLRGPKHRQHKRFLLGNTKYKIKNYTRSIRKKVRSFVRSRWFLVISGLVLIFVSIAYWPDLLDKWPWGGEDFIELLEIPVEVLGGLLFAIGVVISKYHTRVKTIKVLSIVFAIAIGVICGYHHLDETGQIDEWLDRNSPEAALTFEDDYLNLV